MEIRQSVLGEIATHSGANIQSVDIGMLVRRLILFDKVIVKSIRLRELPELVRSFGKTGIQDLLASGLLTFSCESTGLISDVQRNGRRELPLEQFSFGTFEIGKREEMLQKELGALRRVTGLKNLDRQRIEEAVWQSIVRPPSTFGQDMLKQFDMDVRNNNPSIRYSLLGPIRKALFRPEIGIDDLAVLVEEPSPRTFKVITNLQSDFGLPQDRCHELIHSALMAVSELTMRLAEMEAYSAITGFRESERSLLFGRLASVIGVLNPDKFETQFERIIRVVRIPDFAPGQRVDVQLLLKVRDTSECRDFRAWLSSTENMTDSEIEDHATSLRSLIGNLVGGPTGKTLRYATTTLVSLVPGISTLIGGAASALDTFLIEKLFPKSGIVAFLNDQYPSLYKENS